MLEGTEPPIGSLGIYTKQQPEQPGFSGPPASTPTSTLISYIKLAVLLVLTNSYFLILRVPLDQT
jgi:hypothetical protein